MSLSFQEKSATLDGYASCLRGLERAFKIASDKMNKLDEQGNHPEGIGARLVVNALAHEITFIKCELSSRRPPCPGCRYIDDESGQTPEASHYFDCEIVQ